VLLRLLAQLLSGGYTGCSLLLCLMGEQSDENALHVLRLGCGYADPRLLRKSLQRISVYRCSLVFGLGYDHVRKLITYVRKMQMKVQKSAKVGRGRQRSAAARKKDAYIGKIIPNRVDSARSIHTIGNVVRFIDSPKTTCPREIPEVWRSGESASDSFA